MTRVTIDADALLDVDVDQPNSRHRARCRLCNKYFLGAGDQPIEDFVEVISDFHLAADHGVQLAATRPVIEATARNIVNQLGDLWMVSVKDRQALNDRADDFVAGLISLLMPVRGQSTITLPVDQVVQVTEVVGHRNSRCRLCGDRFTHYGDDPANLTAEIVCRQHVTRHHEGILHESSTATSGISIRGDTASPVVQGQPTASTNTGTGISTNGGNNA